MYAHPQLALVWSLSLKICYSNVTTNLKKQIFALYIAINIAFHCEGQNSNLLITLPYMVANYCSAHTYFY